jgi:hypothetical protein
MMMRRCRCDEKMKRYDDVCNPRIPIVYFLLFCVYGTSETSTIVNGTAIDKRFKMHMHIGHGGGTYVCMLAKYNRENVFDKSK